MKSLWKQKSYDLDNGLHVEAIFLKDRHTWSAYVAAPIGSLFSRYSIDQKTTPGGIAHFLEHRLFDTPKGDAFQLFSSLGCDANAFTTYEYTTYYFETATNFLEGIKILLSMTNEITFKEEAVEKEKPIIVEELYMTLDKPAQRLLHGLLENLVSTSYLKEEIVGDKEDIVSTTLEDLKRVFYTCYNPKQLTLFLFGDMDESFIEEIGRIPLHQHEEKHEITSKMKEEPEEIVSSFHITKMDVPLPYIAMGAKRLHLQKKLGVDNETYEALQDIVSNLLFSDGSRFIQEIHDEGLMDTNVSGAFLSSDGIDILYVVTSTSKRDAFMKKVDYFFHHLKEYIDDKSLKRAVRFCLGNALIALDDFSTFTYLYVSRYMRHISMSRMIEMYEKITMDLIDQFIDLWKDAPYTTYILSKDGK